MDTTLFLILGGLLTTIIFLSFIGMERAAEDALNTQSIIDLLTLDQAVSSDIMRGNNITLESNVLNINGALYYNDSGYVKRKAGSTVHELIKGSAVFGLTDKLTITIENITRTYDLFWQF